MKAQLRNGKIVTGKAAEVFIRVGIAEEVFDEIVKEEQKSNVAPVAKRPVKKRKKRGRPKK